MTPERDSRDTHPSVNLAVAGALARAGWTPDRVSDFLQLPLAFAELLCNTARRDGEAARGDDARLIAALGGKLGVRSKPSAGDRPFQSIDGRSSSQRRVSAKLFAWNVAVLSLAMVSNILAFPVSARAVLLAAAALGLILTCRQAARTFATARGRE